MQGETEEMRKERWKGICGIQSCNVHVGKFDSNIITSDTYSILIEKYYLTIY